MTREWLLRAKIAQEVADKKTGISANAVLTSMAQFESNLQVAAAVGQAAQALFAAMAQNQNSSGLVVPR